MDLMELRRGLIHDPELPPQYKRVAYLQSSGTQYISTGLTYVYGYKAHMELLDNPLPYDNLGYLGWWNSASQNNIQSYSINYRRYIVTRGTNNATYDIGTEMNGIITVDGTNISVNGRSHTGNAIPPDIGVQFLLFGYNRSTGVINCAGSCRIFGIEFWDSNHQTVKKFIPCVRASDNKPGMYETMTKSFCVNQGTGEFIVP